MNDGTYFAGWAVHNQGGQASIECAFSSDGGNTWQQRAQVISVDDATHDLDNPFPVQLKNNRIIMAYRNHDRQAYGSYTYFHLGSSYSDDFGQTWTAFTDIDARAHTGAPNDANGIWEPFLRIGRDGNLQAYFSSENNGGDQDSWMKTSTDGGQTWQPWRGIGGGDVTARDGMLGVAPTDNNGGLIAVFETTECGGFCVKAIYSSDDGASWGGRSTVYQPPSGKNAGAPSVQNIYGTMVVSFMTDETMATSTGYDDGEAKVLTSTDGGHTWGNKLTVAGHAHWPGLTYEGENQLSMAVGVDGTGVVRQAIHLSS